MNRELSMKSRLYTGFSNQSDIPNLRAAEIKTLVSDFFTQNESKLYFFFGKRQAQEIDWMKKQSFQDFQAYVLKKLLAQPGYVGEKEVANFVYDELLAPAIRRHSTLAEVCRDLGMAELDPLELRRRLPLFYGKTSTQRELGGLLARDKSLREITSTTGRGKRNLVQSTERLLVAANAAELYLPPPGLEIPLDQWGLLRPREQEAMSRFLHCGDPAQVSKDMSITDAYGHLKRARGKLGLTPNDARTLSNQLSSEIASNDTDRINSNLVNFVLGGRPLLKFTKQTKQNDYIAELAATIRGLMIFLTESRRQAVDLKSKAYNIKRIAETMSVSENVASKYLMHSKRVLLKRYEEYISCTDYPPEVDKFKWLTLSPQEKSVLWAYIRGDSIGMIKKKQLIGDIHLNTIKKYYATAKRKLGLEQSNVYRIRTLTV